MVLVKERWFDFDFQQSGELWVSGGVMVDKERPESAYQFVVSSDDHFMLSRFFQSKNGEGRVTNWSGVREIGSVNLSKRKSLLERWGATVSVIFICAGDTAC